MYIIDGDYLFQLDCALHAWRRTGGRTNGANPGFFNPRRFALSRRLHGKDPIFTEDGALKPGFFKQPAL